MLESRKVTRAFPSALSKEGGGATRLESQLMSGDSTQSQFYKISEFLIGKPTSFAYKDMSIFCFSDDQD